MYTKIIMHDWLCLGHTSADAADRASVFVRPVRNDSYHIRKSPYLYVHYLQGTEDPQPSFDNGQKSGTDEKPVIVRI